MESKEGRTGTYRGEGKRESSVWKKYRICLDPVGFCLGGNRIRKKWEEAINMFSGKLNRANLKAL